MAEKEITFTYKSGYQCTHRPEMPTEDEWWELVAELMSALKTEHPGVLIIHSPFGIHKLVDVQAVHFGDAAPPQESSIPKLGFIKE